VRLLLLLLPLVPRLLVLLVPLPLAADVVCSRYYRYMTMLALGVDGFGMPSDLSGMEVLILLLQMLVLVLLVLRPPPPLTLPNQVLDIGAYNGASSFMLAAMGAKVTAVEEVKKVRTMLMLLLMLLLLLALLWMLVLTSRRLLQYGGTIRYVSDAYQLPITVLSESLYNLDRPELQNRYDIVLYFGVVSPALLRTAAAAAVCSCG